jgi:hypothetical protein
VNIDEKPPPEPNWSVAISALPTVCPTKRVAPTDVTHGEEAGQEGQSTGKAAFFLKPEMVLLLALVCEVTVL